MKSLWVQESIHYDGSQLHSLFGYLDFGVLGDSIVSWRGSCDVHFEHMVDGEDLLASSPIRGQDMLHFIVEIFDQKLFSAVCLQRLFASLVMESLRERSSEDHFTQALHRDGDDIFVGDRKFSISIATVSPNSALIHFAMNITNEGTPVPTISLEDFKLDPKQFAEEIMEQFVFEVQTIKEATQKVRWVK